jgi:cell wall-associated protease
MKSLGLLVLAASVSTSALASTIAVIDSGLDYKHKDLQGVVWRHSQHTDVSAGDNYKSDEYGWNFADKNAEVIDYSFLGTFPDDDYKYFKVQSKVLLGTATDEEKQWIKDKKNDTNCVSGLETFGNFVHGTHVSGIATASRTTERVLMEKIIPTQVPTVPGQGVIDMDRLAQAIHDSANHLYDGNNPFPFPIPGGGGDGSGDDAMTPILLQFYFQMIVDQQMGMLTDAGTYANALKADVANGSFGSSEATLKPQIKKILQSLTNKEPSDADVEKYTKQLISMILDKCKTMVQNAPNTLFVFAAGNDGTSNDDQPTAPASLNEDNTVSVAATLDVNSLAYFSNYGSTVDVAAPGVAINSTIPGDQWLQLSGTSMAAPFVTNVAALAKDANPKLTPAQLKKIILGTVDVKSWLSGKVKTSGVVNTKRAVTAAHLTATGTTLEAAISQAKTAVADTPATRQFVTADTRDITPIPMPSLIHL